MSESSFLEMMSSYFLVKVLFIKLEKALTETMLVSYKTYATTEMCGASSASNNILTCNNGQILNLLTKEIHKDFHTVKSTTKICYIIKIFLESLIREYMGFKTILTTINLNQNELLYKRYKHHEINTCMRPKLLYIKLNKYLIPFQFLDCINVVLSLEFFS